MLKAKLRPPGRAMRTSLAALLALGIGLAPVAAAAQAGPPQGQARKAPDREGRRLPADSTTEQKIDLGEGRALSFKATAGSLGLVDEDGKLQAEIAFIAYLKPGTPEETGGPARDAHLGMEVLCAMAESHLRHGARVTLPVENRAMYVPSR